MPMLASLLSAVVLVLASLLAALPASAEPLTVFVSVAPQRQFVERIAGDRVQALVMVAPGQSPHAFEPKPKDMQALAGAKAYFAVGDPFEATWLPRFSQINPSMLVVRTDASIDKLESPEHHHGEEHHGKGRKAHDKAHKDHDEDADELDPHIWTSPALVKVQAKAILDGLTAIDPQGEAQYRAGFEAFLKEIEAVDSDIRKSLSGLKPGAEFMVFHPAWGYFARDYGLTQVAIEVEGKEPKPRELKEIVERARQLSQKVIFVQPQFSRKAAETVAQAVGGQLVEADPLAEDWAANLRRVSELFAQAAR